MIGDIQYFCDIKVLGAVIFSLLLTGAVRYGSSSRARMQSDAVYL